MKNYSEPRPMDYEIILTNIFWVHVILLLQSTPNIVIVGKVKAEIDFAHTHISLRSDFNPFFLGSMRFMTLVETYI